MIWGMQTIFKLSQAHTKDKNLPCERKKKFKHSYKSQYFTKSYGKPAGPLFSPESIPEPMPDKDYFFEKGSQRKEPLKL
jgi:hypothetical protein